MRGETGTGTSFDLPAVGKGVFWGLIVMLAGALIQGVVAYRSPLSAGTELTLSYVWQGLGALVAGFLAGRRAAGAGWLHGVIAGMGLALVAAGVMGVLTTLPIGAALLKGLGAGGAVGALAGIAGVNFGER